MFTEHELVLIMTAARTAANDETLSKGLRSEMFKLYHKALNTEGSDA